MNILYVTPIFKPVQGGASQYFFILSNGLKSKDDIEKIFILTEYFPSSKVIEKMSSKVTIMRVLLPRQSVQPTSKFYYMASFIINQCLLLAAIVFLKILFGVEIVHYHSGMGNIALRYPNFLFIFLAKWKSVTICDIRDLFSLPMSPNWADLFICASERIKNEIGSFCLPESRRPVIPVPIDRPIKADNKSIKELKLRFNLDKYLLYVGDITYKKGIFDLLQAFQIFAKTNKKFKLILVGRNTMKDGRFERYTVAKNILYLGPCSKIQTYMLIQAAEMLILPSRLEGMPRVCLEAISLGTKFIYPNSVQEFEYYFPEFCIKDNSPQGLAKLIEQALKREMHLENYPINRHYKENVFPKYLTIYRKLLLEQKIKKGNA